MRHMIHFKAGEYLPLTENWIYSQITSIKHFTVFFYAYLFENLDSFPYPRLRQPWLFKNTWRILKFVDLQFKKRTKMFLSFLLSMRQDNPCLFHAHFGPSGYELLPYLQYFKAPLITTFYGYDVTQLVHEEPEWRERYKKLFEKGKFFLVEGPHMKQELIKLGCPEEKVIVHHIGIDVERIQYQPRRFPGEGPVRILVAGRFCEKKGIPYAIEAFAHVLKRFPNVELTIIGDSRGSEKDEKEKERILTRIQSLHIGHKIRMLGFVSREQFFDELYAHHILLSPSVRASDNDTEGGAPVTLLEASASGMLIVSTYHCDIPEVVRDGETGLLAPEKDVETLAKHIEFFLSHPEKWEFYAQQARHYMEKEFNLTVQVQRLEFLYERALASTYENSFPVI